MRRWAIGALALLFALSAAALVFGKGPGNKKGQGPEKGKSTSVSVVVSKSGHRATGPSSTPPGWSQGKKTGWGGGAEPPGLAKKSGGTSVVVHAGTTTGKSRGKGAGSTGVSVEAKKGSGKGAGHAGRGPKP